MNGTINPHFSVNTANDLVVLPEPFEEYETPQPGDLITAGFEFDVPCRLDTDQLSIGLQYQNLGSFSIKVDGNSFQLISLTSFESIG